jgi:hypothetical protein
MPYNFIYRKQTNAKEELLFSLRMMVEVITSTVVEYNEKMIKAQNL